MSICENCKYLRKDYFIKDYSKKVVEKRLCILTGEVPPINKRSCKKFEQVYEVKNRLSQNIKGDGNNA